MTTKPKPDHALDTSLATIPAGPQIAEALKDLRFGEVTVIVQDGQIVQIDRLEKRRLRAAATLPIS